MPSDELPDSNKSEWNWLNLLIYAYWIFLAFVIVSYLYTCLPRITLDSNILVLFFLLFVLSLSHVFNHFSIGKLIQVSREKNELKNKAREISEENKDLRTQLINCIQVSNKNSQNQNVNVYPHPPKVEGEEKPDAKNIEPLREEGKDALVTPELLSATATIPEAQVKTIVKKNKKIISALTEKTIKELNITYQKSYLNAHLVPKNKIEDSLSLYPIFDAFLLSGNISIYLEFIIEKEFCLDRIKYLAKMTFDVRSSNQNAILYLILSKNLLKDDLVTVNKQMVTYFQKSIEINLIQIYQI